MVFTQIALTVIGTCLSARFAVLPMKVVGELADSEIVKGLASLLWLVLCLVGMAASWELAGALLHSLTAEATALGV